ncbi:cyanophycinase [Gemmatimonadota bacterium DH-20]|uniref:Cyanophycinase n=1 Tax=Gaopeijia maritima TaxID=3119007 RepID=A0ABU9EB67_9BACT
MAARRGARRASTGAATGVALALGLAMLPATPAAGQDAPVVGPERGSLVIVGGALRDPEIVQAFIERAGGPDAAIVVIPTAGGGDDSDYGAECSCLNQLRANGARNLTVLHSYDPEVADTEAFVAPLEQATGVWFPGGRQWRLADAYLGTRTERALRAVLDRGGVIGGTSAGASIQGSYLARGDTRSNTVMMGDHEVGFGYLRETAIDQHLLARNRQFDLLEVIEVHPELLGIGIDEDTAVLVDGDRMEVMGGGYVAVYDAGARLPGGGPYYLLRDGDTFDLSTRTPARGGRPFLDLVRIDPTSGGD